MKIINTYIIPSIYLNFGQKLTTSGSHIIILKLYTIIICNPNQHDTCMDLVKSCRKIINTHVLDIYPSHIKMFYQPEVSPSSDDHNILHPRQAQLYKY